MNTPVVAARGFTALAAYWLLGHLLHYRSILNTRTASIPATCWVSWALITSVILFLFLRKAWSIGRPQNLPDFVYFIIAACGSLMCIFFVGDLVGRATVHERLIRPGIMKAYFGEPALASSKMIGFRGEDLWIAGETDVESPDGRMVIQGDEAFVITEELTGNTIPMLPLKAVIRVTKKAPYWGDTFKINNSRTLITISGYLPTKSLDTDRISVVKGYLSATVTYPRMTGHVGSKGFFANTTKTLATHPFQVGILPQSHRNTLESSVAACQTADKGVTIWCMLMSLPFTLWAYLMLLTHRGKWQIDSKPIEFS